MLRDRQGRHRIFHGVNVVTKQHPYMPITDHFDIETSLVQEDIDDLKKWGMTMVRLGLMWEAVETAPGVYNYTYLE